MVLGFLLTLFYKTVLQAMLTYVSYEKTIDTIDDMVASDRKLWASSDTVIRDLLDSDPRVQVKKIAQRTTSYTHGRGTWEEVGENVHLG